MFVVEVASTVSATSIVFIMFITLATVRGLDFSYDNSDIIPSHRRLGYVYPHREGRGRSIYLKGLGNLSLL